MRRCSPLASNCPGVGLRMRSLMKQPLNPDGSRGYQARTGNALSERLQLAAMVADQGDEARACEIALGAIQCAKEVQ